MIPPIRKILPPHAHLPVVLCQVQWISAEMPLTSTLLRQIQPTMCPKQDVGCCNCNESECKSGSAEQFAHNIQEFLLWSNMHHEIKLGTVKHCGSDDWYCTTCECAIIDTVQLCYHITSPPHQSFRALGGSATPDDNEASGGVDEMEMKDASEIFDVTPRLSGTVCELHRFTTKNAKLSHTFFVHKRATSHSSSNTMSSATFAIRSHLKFSEVRIDSIVYKFCTTDGAEYGRVVDPRDWSSGESLTSLFAIGSASGGTEIKAEVEVQLASPPRFDNKHSLNRTRDASLL